MVRGSTIGNTKLGWIQSLLNRASTSTSPFVAVGSTNAYQLPFAKRVSAIRPGPRTTDQTTFVSPSAGPPPTFALTFRMAFVPLTRREGLTRRFSYLSVVNAIVPAVVESLDEEQRAMAQPLLAQLPKELKGGMASATWREGDTFKALCRISADEIKGIGAAVNVGMSFAMMQAMKGAATGAAGALGDEDDVDDEEVDDDDED